MIGIKFLVPDIRGFRECEWTKNTQNTQNKNQIVLFHVKYFIY